MLNKEDLIEAENEVTAHLWDNFYPILKKKSDEELLVIEKCYDYSPEYLGMDQFEYDTRCEIIDHILRNRGYKFQNNKYQKL